MTRKHYEAIAEGFLYAAPNETWLNKRIQWRHDCLEVARQLYRTSKYTPNGNKSFDTTRFLKKCGWTKEELSEANTRF